MGQKVLIIEEDDLLGSVLSDLLECENFEVQRAREWFTGLRLAQSSWIDLILCDVNWRDFNQFDVLKILCQNQELRRIPLIFLVVDREQGISVVKKGATDYLITHLISKSLLLEKIAQCLHLTPHRCLY